MSNLGFSKLSRVCQNCVSWNTEFFQCDTEHLGHFCHLIVMHDRPQNAECQLAFCCCEHAAAIPLFLLSRVNTIMPGKEKHIYLILCIHLKPNLRIYCYKDQLSDQGEIMF